MSEMTQELIQQALDQDFNSANKTFADIMSVKLNDVMDQEQIKLADQVFNGVEADDEEEIELATDSESEEETETEEESGEDVELDVDDEDDLLDELDWDDDDTDDEDSEES